MAKLTNAVELTTDWAEISTGLATALISMNPAKAGFAEIAIADAGTDLTADDRGHRMTPVDFSVANFFGLDGRKICARKFTADPVELIVTEYDPVA